MILKIFLTILKSRKIRQNLFLKFLKLYYIAKKTIIFIVFGILIKIFSAR